MIYKSIEEIKDDFQFDSNDVEIFRDSLNKIRAELHPDRNSGEFKDEIEKAKFLKVNDAIAFIDSLKNNNQLMVFDKMTELIKVVSELIPNTKEASLQSNLETRIEYAIGHYKSRLFLPKISLTAITAVLTFLYTIPSQIKSNESLSNILNPKSGAFLMIWITSLIYTMFLWLITYINDEKAKNRLSLLKVDSFQNKVFEGYLNQIESNAFSKDELTQYIFQKNSIGSRSFLNLGSQIITLEVAQSISELIISRAEKKGIIEKLITNSLSDNFIIKTTPNKSV